MIEQCAVLFAIEKEGSWIEYTSIFYANKHTINKMLKPIRKSIQTIPCDTILVEFCIQHNKNFYAITNKSNKIGTDLKCKRGPGRYIARPLDQIEELIVLDLNKIYGTCFDDTIHSIFRNLKQL